MKPQKFTQFGTATVILFSFIIIVFLIITITSGPDTPALPAVLIVGSVLIIALLLFYKLTIYIDQHTLSFRMGIGLIRKTYQLSNIRSCEPVKNKVIYGLGIRVLPNGKLYNVSGLHAIELRFKDRNSVVRIGTNQPAEISNLVQSLIGQEKTDNHSSALKEQTFAFHLLWIVPVLVALLIMIIPRVTETKVILDETGIDIKGLYGERIPYTKIIETDKVSSLPEISYRANGYALAGTLLGKFRTRDHINIKLFVKSAHPPYIYIKSTDRLPVYLHFKDTSKTHALYKRIENQIMSE